MSKILKFPKRHRQCVDPDTLTIEFIGKYGITGVERPFMRRLADSLRELAAMVVFVWFIAAAATIAIGIPVALIHLAFGTF